MLDAVSGIFIGNQVIVFVIPGQAPWRDFVQIAAFLGNKLFFYIPGTVLEADLFIFRNRRVDDVDVCIDPLIVCLGPIVNVNLALKPGGVFNACKSLQFSDQLHWKKERFFFSAEDAQTGSRDSSSKDYPQTFVIRTFL